jgi:hypothetical protein
MKAINPVIGAIFLLGITLGVVSLVSVWYPKIVKTHLGAIEEQARTEAECTYVSIDSYDAEINSTSLKLTFFVDNTGNKKVKITNNIIIYKDGSKDSFNESVELGVDDVVMFSYDANSTDILKIRTTTECPGKYDEIKDENIAIV